MKYTKNVKSRFNKLFFHSFCTLIFCVFLVACSSSSTSPSPSDEVVTDPIPSDNSEVGPSTSIDYVWLIDENSPIVAVGGESRTVTLLSIDSGTIQEMELLGAPSWVGLDSEWKLVLSPSANERQSELQRFSISGTVVDENGEQINISASAVVSLASTITLLSGQMPRAGGEVVSDWRDVIISSIGSLDNSYLFDYSMIDKGAGRYTFELTADPAISESDLDKLTIETAAPELLYLNYVGLESKSNRSAAAGRAADTASTVNPDSVFTVPAECAELAYSDSYKNDHQMSHVWWGSAGVFITSVSGENSFIEDGGEPRVVPSQETIFTKGIRSYFDDFYVDWDCGAALQSSISSLDSQGIAGREPVLFIHGFDSSGKLGGDDSYFRRFPAIVESAVIDQRRFFPLTFRWQTNARFDVVAHELYQAIDRIHRRTGKKVHIVSHSFGGVLVRTLLQRITFNAETSPPSQSQLEERIATVTTVGSPHSGIFKDPTEISFGGITRTFNSGFADGFYGKIGERCDAVSCHFLGIEYASWKGKVSNWSKFRLGVGITNVEPGLLAFRLASSFRDTYPSIPTNALIGSFVEKERFDLALGPVDSREYDVFGHDLLISSYGQLWNAQTNRGLLQNIEGKSVSEHFLGHRYVSNNTFFPGMFDEEFRHTDWKANNVLIDGGYAHMTGKSDDDNYSEVGLEACSAENPNGCRHAVWHYFKNLVKNTPQSDSNIAVADTFTVQGVIEYDGKPISEMLVNIAYDNGLGVNTKTDSDGFFSAELDFIENQSVSVLSKPNKITQSASTTGLRANLIRFTTAGTVEKTTGNVGVIELFGQELVSGNFTISFIDAISGSPVNGFSYKVLRSDGVQVASGSSGPAYIVELQLPLGYYTVQITKLGLDDVSYQCDHLAGQTECSAGSTNGPAETTDNVIATDFSGTEVSGVISSIDVENDPAVRLSYKWIMDNLNTQLHSQDCGARPEFGRPPESIYGWLPIQADINAIGRLESTLMGRSVYACTFIRRGMTSSRRTLNESIKVTGCRGFAYFSDIDTILDSCD